MDKKHFVVRLSNGNIHVDDRYGSVIATDLPEAARLGKLDVAYAILRAGATSPPHYHERTEEVYAITRGEGVVTVDGVSTLVQPGEVVRIPVYTVHSVAAGPEGLEFWVSTSPPYTTDDDIETDAPVVLKQELTDDGSVSPLTIAVIVGTNRRGSISAKLGRQICNIYQDIGINTDLIDLAELPPETFSPESFEHRYESDTPTAQRLIKAAGLHVVTPEYNGSYPGVLKHVLDVQPYEECFDRKPIALVGLAAGQWGGLRAVEQLQAVFGYRNAFIFPERVFIREIGADQIDETGVIADRRVAERLERQAAGFVEFVTALKGVQRRSEVRVP